METKVVNHHNQDFTLYRFNDHLWISDANERGEHFIQEFSLQKMLWNLSFYTSDELESIFNVSLQFFNSKHNSKE